MPKGVEITHRNFIANTLQVLQAANLSPSERALPSRALGMLPMYHAVRRPPARRPRAPC